MLVSVLPDARAVTIDVSRINDVITQSTNVKGQSNEPIAVLKEQTVS